MQYAGLGKLVLEIIKESQPILSSDIAKIIGSKAGLEIGQQEINTLLYRHLADQVVKDGNHHWSLRKSIAELESTTQAYPKVSTPAVSPTQINSVISKRYLTNHTHDLKSANPSSSKGIHTDNANALSLSNLASYYLEALALERDSEIKLYAKPFDESRPNYLVLNGMPIYEDNTSVWPGSTRQFIATKPRAKNVNLYIGYPVFIQKTRPGTSDVICPLFLFNLQIDEADKSGYPTLGIDPPRINSEAFKRTGAAFGDIQEDLKGMRAALGLDVDDERELPTAIELIERLKGKYPLWPWQELIDLTNLSTSDLNSKTDGGVYNSAILFWGEGSKFVQGLEAELREIRGLSPQRYSQSVLTPILNGKPELKPASKPKSIHRHLPLNPSQAQAVEAALINPLTIITGPPGTGKSQVVGSIITNAALDGQSVLVSSKNHKAIDVVVERVNSLSEQPFLLKIGSEANSSDVVHLVNILTARNRQNDHENINKLKTRSESLQRGLLEHQALLDKAVETRNRVDNLSKGLPDNTTEYGPPFIFNSDLPAEEKEKHFKKLCDTIAADLKNLAKAKRSIDIQNMGYVRKLLWALNKKARLANTTETIQQIAGRYALRVPGPQSEGSNLVATCESLTLKLEEALRASTDYGAYLREIPLLKSIDISANQERYLSTEDKLATIDLEYWQEWLRQLPGRLSPEDFQLISSYAAIVQLANSGDDSDKRKIADKIKRLTQKVTHVLPAWAVTSLSLRNRVPFDDGLFDLVVIDEASQCDIASAIPLLFRAKRAVIIGDPQQLKHITSLIKAADARLMNQFGILEHPIWGYSTNSLFDVMAASPIAKRFTLNEHHRSDEAIINFSNKHFYDGSLIVATRHRHLKRSASTPNLCWVHTSGQVVAPSGSGAMNSQEVGAVHRYLKDLLLTRGYEGTVGVVTPFRKQANRIRETIEGDLDLQRTLNHTNLLIDTVHKFQGDERDVMIFSPVISNGMSPSATGFLQSQGNLFNVAITRARSHLVIVGDLEHCRNSEIKYMSAFAKYYDEFNSRRITPPSKSESLPDIHPLSNDPRVSIWEVRLYKALRAVGLLPLPQYAEDKYALDFALFRQDGAKLNIEVDGEMYHKSWTGQRLRSDTIRNQTLIELGWHVKRFWVYQLKEDMGNCVKEIQEWAQN